VGLFKTCAHFWRGLYSGCQCVIRHTISTSIARTRGFPLLLTLPERRLPPLLCSRGHRTPPIPGTSNPGRILVRRFDSKICRWHPIFRSSLHCSFRIRSDGPPNCSLPAHPIYGVFDLGRPSCPITFYPSLQTL
jgi:hypothetical protein